MEVAIQFMIFGYFSAITGVLVYLHNDRTAYKELKKDLIAFINENKSLKNLVSEINSSQASLRSVIREQKLSIEKVEQYNDKLLDQIHLINGKYKKINERLIPRKHIIEIVDKKKIRAAL